MTQPTELPPKDELKEGLQTAFDYIQQSKRGSRPLDMRPIWHIVNSVPSVLARLSALEDALRNK